MLEVQPEQLIFNTVHFNGDDKMSQFIRIKNNSGHRQSVELLTYPDEIEFIKFELKISNRVIVPAYKSIDVKVKFYPNIHEVNKNVYLIIKCDKNIIEMPVQIINDQDAVLSAESEIIGPIYTPKTGCDQYITINNISLKSGNMKVQFYEDTHVKINDHEFYIEAGQSQKVKIMVKPNNEIRKTTIVPLSIRSMENDISVLSTKLKLLIVSESIEVRIMDEQSLPVETLDLKTVYMSSSIQKCPVFLTNCSFRASRIFSSVSNDQELSNSFQLFETELIKQADKLFDIFPKSIAINAEQTKPLTIMMDLRSFKGDDQSDDKLIIKYLHLLHTSNTGEIISFRKIPCVIRLAVQKIQILRSQNLMHPNCLLIRNCNPTSNFHPLSIQIRSNTCSKIQPRSFCLDSFESRLVALKAIGEKVELIVDVFEKSDGRSIMIGEAPLLSYTVHLHINFELLSPESRLVNSSELAVKLRCLRDLCNKINHDEFKKLVDAVYIQNEQNIENTMKMINPQFTGKPNYSVLLSKTLPPIICRYGTLIYWIKYLFAGYFTIQLLKTISSHSTSRII
ncbi:hypothetical protein GJ496_005766 [Pomphorhynchus laevis]|nr:hypothetical protein GJ496_005766 [Pomphorhynchus laevis]